MLESMLLAGHKPGSVGPWNGVYPAEDSNTLFRMHTFSALADVKDKGPNAISVTNNNVTVGNDALNSFMRFNGLNGYLTFANSLLSTNSMDITIIIGDIVYPTAAPYYFTVLDGRPANTNGRYASFAVIQNPPFKPVTIFQTTEYISPDTVAATEFPAVIKYQIRPGSFTTFVNGAEIYRVTAADNAFANPQNWSLGKSAFSSIGGVPWLNAKIYYVDFKKV